MNDVTLNSTDLKLARSGEAVPARALSSSSADGMRAAGSVGSDFAASQNVSASVKSPSATGNVVQQQALTPADQAAQARESKESQKEKLTSAVSKLNDYVQSVQRDLQFEVDSELGQVIVKVVDQKTQQVIRQMPDELALRLAEKLQQDEPLTFFNIKV
ncbi:flagellar protein FlaG [Marinobacter psychrophilus]|uniref:flagellar protein FlaG n=1 Tax=Marinobacter psychrophilus TaxID=330734 RepID=UPI001B50A6DF|nr:flagellar protein FlaG [Marinobacter psychrophilus]MBQ0762852.1 flagellar protein FlaG [Marinobacter psychrophilus]MBQ0846210.1 flagellar protein FlaG [Marinobacter psychrophilus]